MPNVFRLTSLLDDDTQHLFEYQDLSRKEILVQGNGLKGESLFEMGNQFSFESLTESPVCSLSKKIKKAGRKLIETVKTINPILRHD